MKYWLILAFTLRAVSWVYAQSNMTESLTITTYYPSPYGVYRDMEIHRSVKYHAQNDLNTVPSPVDGQLVYLKNASEEGFYYYNGYAWQSQSGGGGGGGVCYTNFGGTACHSGYTAVLTGVMAIFGTQPANLAGPICSSVIVSAGVTSTFNPWIQTKMNDGKYFANDPCAICCK